MPNSENDQFLPFLSSDSLRIIAAVTGLEKLELLIHIIITVIIDP